MSKGFLPLLITAFSAVGIYYFWSVYLKLNSNVGMIIGLLVALLLSVLFSLLKNKKKKNSR